MKPVSLLIFDLDGTLVDTLGDISTSLNHTLDHFGRPRLEDNVVMRFVGDGIRNLIIRSFRTTDGIAEAVEVYKEHHRRNLTVRSALYPGVQETLQYFRSIPMAVISNKSTEFVTPLLDRMGIAGYFRVVIGADQGLPLKPAPDAIERIASSLGAPKERTVMVGDGTTDIEAGKAAGVTTCGATYGFRSEEELRNARPDYLIHSFPELKNLFVPGS